jgi:Protein of unknown function (DUF3054)
VQASVAMTTRPDHVRHPTGAGSPTAEPRDVVPWEWVGAVADLVVVLVFVGIGRSTHHHGAAIAGMASTSWPFLCGLGAGWVALVALGRPRIPLSGGVVIVLTTVALGMVLRVVSGQGTAFAFILVALAFLGAAMLGWRLVWLGLGKRQGLRRT